MNISGKIEMQKFQDYHYILLGFAKFKDVINKLQRYLKFYRIENQGKSTFKEIIYDAPDNILSDAGIVISKQYEEKRIFFEVRKISWLPGALKRPSRKFILGELQTDEEPKDFSLEISAAIENSFSTPFSTDLDSLVRQTFPKIEINIDSEKYMIIGGTGFRAAVIYENVKYKDIKTGKTEIRDDVTVRLFTNEEYQEENKKLFELINREIYELGQFNASRFEIAQKLLYPKDEEEEE